MSEQPVHVAEHWRGGGPADPGAAPPPGDGAPAPDGSGGFMSARWGPLPVWGWAVVAGVLAVGAFFWMRRGSSQAAASQAAASQAATASTGGPCYDSSGNSVPCGQADYASQIADLQSEIDNLQGAGSTPISSGSPSTMQTSVPDVTGDGVAQARMVIQAAGLWATVQGGNSRGRGTVTAQSPSAGTVVNIGTQVTLTVTSTQPATPVTPPTTPPAVTAQALPLVTQVTTPTGG